MCVCCRWPNVRAGDDSGVWAGGCWGCQDSTYQSFYVLFCATLVYVTHHSSNRRRAARPRLPRTGSALGRGGSTAPAPSKLRGALARVWGGADKNNAGVAAAHRNQPVPPQLHRVPAGTCLAPASGAAGRPRADRLLTVC